MSSYPIIQSIFIGRPKIITDERGTWRSSICRDRVHEPVPVQKGGLAGDKVTQSYHGGPDADICVYLLDHYRFWNEHYGLDLQPGNVGESFTLDAIAEDQICAGDIVRIGIANRCFYLHFDPKYARRLIQMDGLGDWWKEQVLEKGKKQGEHWTATIKDLLPTAYCLLLTESTWSSGWR